MFKKIILCVFALMLMSTMAFADIMCECTDSKTAPVFEDDGHTFIMKIMCLDCGLPKSITTNITHTWVNGVCACGAKCPHNYVNYICTACGMEAEGKPCDHEYKEIKREPATCQYAAYVWSKCIHCGNEKGYEVGTPDTTEHKYVHNATKMPTCTDDGTTWYKCERCGDINEVTIPNNGHKYSWVVVKKPTVTEDGYKEYKCDVCGHVDKTEVTRYTKWYYNNTMCSFGPTTRELIGGNDWYRVTPVDITIDGTYTYDLIASNLYVIGRVDIVVSNGAMVVDYFIDVDDVVIHAADLLLYGSKRDMKRHNAVVANVGDAIDLVGTFGEDNVVIVSLILTGDYDAAHRSVTRMKIDEDVINQMIEMID